MGTPWGFMKILEGSSYFAKNKEETFRGNACLNRDLERHAVSIFICLCFFFFFRFSSCCCCWGSPSWRCRRLSVPGATGERVPRAPATGSVSGARPGASGRGAHVGIALRLGLAFAFARTRRSRRSASPTCAARPLGPGLAPPTSSAAAAARGAPTPAAAGGIVAIPPLRRGPPAAAAAGAAPTATTTTEPWPRPAGAAVRRVVRSFQPRRGEQASTHGRGCGRAATLARALLSKNTEI